YPTATSLSTDSITTTTKASSTTHEVRSSSKGGTSSGLIAGLTIGLGLPCLGIGGYIVWKYHKKRKRDHREEERVGYGTLENSPLSPTHHAPITPFVPQSFSSFTEHPTFKGAIQAHIYEIWKDLT